LQRTDIVVVSDIYNIKGFEFSLIVIVALGEGEFPPRGVPFGETWREALRLYVAMTRGRDEVCLVYQGEPSPFITAMSGAVTPRPLRFAEANTPTASPETVASPSTPAETKFEVPAIKPPVSPPEPQVLPEGESVPAIDNTPVPATVVIQAPEPEEMVLNGVSLLIIRGEPTVRSVARALGRDITPIHNDFMSHGVFTAPDAPVVRAYAHRVMEKYGCSPIFRDR
jgi:hypothetical protein